MSAPKEVDYVVFMSPGSFVAETSERKISSWDAAAAVEMAGTIVARYGARPYGFRFERRLEAEPISDGRGGTMRVEPKTIATSPMHFIAGHVETLDDVIARNDPKEQILRSNMECNNPVVVVTTNGYRSVQPFEDDDAVVDEHGTVTARASDERLVAYRKAWAEKKKREYEARWGKQS